MNLSKENFFANIRILIRHAGERDPAAAKELLKIAASLLRKGEPIPEELAEWLATAFENIVNGKEAEKALKLTKGSGGSKKFSEDEEEMIAEYIHHSEKGLHRGSGGRATPSGVKGVGAYVEAKDMFGGSLTTLEKIYEKYRYGFEIQEEIEREARDL